MLSANQPTVRLLKVLLHLGFFISGIATVLIGQVLPIFKQKFQLDDGQLGVFFPAQLAGSLCGTFLTNWFGRRNRFLLASLTGCFLMGIGVLLLNLNSYELCLFGFFVNGLGIGLTLPAMNMLILELNPERAAAALSVLNFFWGVGAIVSQPFVDFLSAGAIILVPTLILTVALFVIGGALLLIPKEIEHPPATETQSSDEANVPIWTNPLAWLIALFNFVNVGFESSMGGWLKTYTQRIDEAVHLLPPIFLYFVFFVVGRGVAPFFLRYLRENQMLLASLLLVLLGMIILLVANDVGTLSLGASIAGFGTSSTFPMNMSRFTQTFGPSASRRAMPFFICGTLGAAFTSWFIGFTSDRFNSLHSGMFVLLGCTVILIVLQLFLQTRKKPAA